MAIYLTNDTLKPAAGDIEMATFSSAWIRLVSSFTGTPDANMDPSSYTEASYSSYSAVSVTSWSSSRSFLDGGTGINTQVSFLGADGSPTETQQIVGWVATNGTSATVVYFWEEFPETARPIMGGASTQLNLNIPVELYPGNSIGTAEYM